MKKLIAYLVLSISCFAADQNYFRWGTSSRQGDRPNMEDRTMSVYPLKENTMQGLFGIFDGHGGEPTAEYVASNFESFFCNNMKQ